MWLFIELNKEYHDKEWGIQLVTMLPYFEFLLLETFQAGLS
jgi:DNA-3-methyladenine glycosylase I